MVSFDESLNDITQTCQMEILIRYWDINDNVKVRYWRYSFLGHSTHSDLLKHFNESVRIRFNGWTCSKLEILWYTHHTHRSECELPQLINIGSCSLHTVHGALKTAVESISWNIKATLKGI